MLVPATVFSQSDSLPLFLKDSLDQYVANALIKWQIPGVALCIVKDGKVVLMKGYGVKEINGTWTGSRMPRANMNAVLEFRIPIPPMEKQRSIVNTLAALTTEIKKLEEIYRQKLADLGEFKKSILKMVFANSS